MFIIYDAHTQQFLSRYSANSKEWRWADADSEAWCSGADLHIFHTATEANMAKVHVEDEFLKTEKPETVKFRVLSVKSETRYNVAW